jgi:hypothetical protein
LQSEAERISDSLDDPNARFWLGNLNMPITIENVSQHVDPKPLRFGENVEYLYLKDYKTDPLQEIESQSTRKLTMKELRDRIDALPPWKRVRATQLALEMYGEKLYQDETSHP